MSSLSLVLNIVSIVLSVICLATFIIGAVGFANQERVVDNVSWIYASEDNNDVFIGLRKLYGTFVNTDFQTGFKASTCTFDYCEACEKDGLAAFGLLIISLFFTTAAIALSASLLAVFKTGVQIANVFVTFTAAGASLAAVAIFMGDCYPRIDDATTLDINWGPGSILSIIGMGLMWIVVVVQIVASAVGSDVAASKAVDSGKATNRF